MQFGFAWKDCTVFRVVFPGPQFSLMRRIQSIFVGKESKRRLMDMGLTRHTKVLLRKIAPLGDPIEISLRGYELTLRKSEAQMISVVRTVSEGNI